MGTSHEDQYTFLIISGSFLLGIRNIPEKVADEIKTRFLLNNYF